ncbi:MAG: RHS repeat-associated core domain-containing protein [Planctomycetaceae bacterium]|jgi:RHS repeat-associated protein|nr:RHS repeat-associated core domain-containing protein [Planctomycetaceae bacterium]
MLNFEYNAFGQLLSKTGNTDCVFKYTGKMTDEVTGLQWNINRWYDAKVGRWISEDPIRFLGGDFNLYRYVKNLLLIYLDPFGHLAKKLEYHAYIKNWNWPFPTTDTVHISFDITLECTCGPQVLIRDTNGPTVIKNNLDTSSVVGPNIIDFARPGQNSNYSKKITWGGGAEEGDMPGWSVGFNAGGTVGAVIAATPPYAGIDAVFVPIGILVGTLTGGLFELVFDDEIIWIFSWEITAYCEKNQYNVWVLNVTSFYNAEYEDNDWDDYYPDYSESWEYVMPN